ncbi:MAG: extracellular solute-binding protein [Clostridia bacterium]|nr:extracellular solute-binding protein [Clostridia bacterium]
MKRTLALLLAMMMCLSVMVACGTKTDAPAATTTAGTDNAGENTTVGTDVTTEPAETKEELEITIKPEYAGKLINILCCGNWSYDEFWAEEITGEPLNDARYNMSTLLGDLMGVTIQVEEDFGSSGGSGKGFTKVTTSTMAGDHAYDIASIGTYDVSSLAYQGYLYDLNEMANIDLSKSWWDPKAQEQLEIDGRMFYTTGDAMTLDNNCTYCILFNKTMVANNNLDNPYELVKNNEWTQEKMIQMATGIGADLDGNGTYDDNDQYGFLIWTDSAIGIMHAAGARFATIENGSELVYSLNNEKNLAVLERWINVRNEQNNKFIEGDGSIKSFEEGRVLFYTRYINSVHALRELELDFGILPYPKGDAEQAEYCNTLHAYGNALMCIPDAADPEMSAAIMEAMSYYGQQELLPAYYDITLVGKGIRDAESEEMLDIIFATRFFDVGTYYQIGNLNVAVNNQLINGSNNLASMLKASEKVIEKTLTKINDGFDSIE